MFLSVSVTIRTTGISVEHLVVPVRAFGQTSKSTPLQSDTMKHSQLQFVFTPVLSVHSRLTLAVWSPNSRLHVHHDVFACTKCCYVATLLLEHKTLGVHGIVKWDKPGIKLPARLNYVFGSFFFFGCLTNGFLRNKQPRR